MCLFFPPFSSSNSNTASPRLSRSQRQCLRCRFASQHHHRLFSAECVCKNSDRRVEISSREIPNSQCSSMLIFCAIFFRVLCSSRLSSPSPLSSSVVRQWLKVSARRAFMGTRIDFSFGSRDTARVCVCVFGLSVFFWSSMLMLIMAFQSNTTRRRSSWDVSLLFY